MGLFISSRSEYKIIVLVIKSGWGPRVFIGIEGLSCFDARVEGWRGSVTLFSCKVAKNHRSGCCHGWYCHSVVLPCWAVILWCPAVLSSCYAVILWCHVVLPCCAVILWCPVVLSFCCAAVLCCHDVMQSSCCHVILLYCPVGMLCWLEWCQLLHIVFVQGHTFFGPSVVLFILTAVLFFNCDYLSLSFESSCTCYMSSAVVLLFCPVVMSSCGEAMWLE